MKPAFFIAIFILLVVPLILINQNTPILSFFAYSNQEQVFFLQRATGLYGFTLIFLQIVLGSGRTWLSQFFPSSKVITWHKTIGKIALLAIISHPFLAFFIPSFLPEFFQNNPLGFLAGTAAFALIMATVFSALLAAKIGPAWIKIHRFNYLVFVLILFHSWQIGADTHNSLAILWQATLGLVVGFLFAKKLLGWMRKPLVQSVSKESNPTQN
ncbi:hypothetical protein HY388_00490 [Candidatus Daviesbacteria bacterium]|nr:hypothetical protein [Candidatus Daviesbacteria bacterium]